MTREQEILRAKELLIGKEPDLAWKLIEKQLTKNPDDAEALMVAAHIMKETFNNVHAYHFARRVTELAPDKFQGWNLFGHLSDILWQVEQSERCLRKAVKTARNNMEKADALLNLACLYIQTGDYNNAEPLCKQSLLLNPESRKSRANLGFCQLANRNWAEGWDNYHYSLGASTRKKVQYKDEPEWDGERGLNVAIYGEQGIGDEISFASMFDDAIAVCNKVVIDCDKRLQGLFARSFPKAKVYGTRTDRYVTWADEDQSIHASAPMGFLGGLYRRTPESFTGKPYLIADPDRVLMWESLFKAKGKPCIGIAWSGGLPHTGEKFRQWSLKDLLPILKSIDAHWVSLQYKDASAEIEEFKKQHPEIDIVQYPHGTLTKDYDDTAAMVKALGRIICMQTAVAHLAGGLGVKCDVFVPKNSQWRYGTFNDIPWYSSVNVIRQKQRGKWEQEINEYAGNSRSEVGGLSSIRAAAA